MSCWQDDTCKLFRFLLTCKGPWPSSQTHSKTLKVKWRPPCSLLLLVTSSQPGYNSYLDGGLFVHWSRGRCQVDHRARDIHSDTLSFPFCPRLTLHQGVPSSLSLSGVWFYPCRPCRSVFLGFLLSQVCLGRCLLGTLVLLAFPVVFLSYAFLLVLAGLCLLLKPHLHSPSSRGNRHGWYSVSILTGSSMHLLSWFNLIILNISKVLSGSLNHSRQHLTGGWISTSVSWTIVMQTERSNQSAFFILNHSSYAPWSFKVLVRVFSCSSGCDILGPGCQLSWRSRTSPVSPAILEFLSPALVHFTWRGAVWRQT